MSRLQSTGFAGKIFNRNRVFYLEEKQGTSNISLKPEKLDAPFPTKINRRNKNFKKNVQEKTKKNGKETIYTEKQTLKDNSAIEVANIETCKSLENEVWPITPPRELDVDIQENHEGRESQLIDRRNLEKLTQSATTVPMSLFDTPPIMKFHDNFYQNQYASKTAQYTELETYLPLSIFDTPPYMKKTGINNKKQINKAAKDFQDRTLPPTPFSQSMDPTQFESPVLSSINYPIHQKKSTISESVQIIEENEKNQISVPINQSLELTQSLPPEVPPIDYSILREDFQEKSTTESTQFLQKESMVVHCGETQEKQKSRKRLVSEHQFEPTIIKKSQSITKFELTNDEKYNDFLICHSVSIAVHFEKSQGTPLQIRFPW